MAKDTKIGAVEVRRFETPVGETGASGETQRQDVSYELGAEIDGVFVRFGVVSEGQIDTFRARSEAAKAGDTPKATTG